MQLRLTNRGGYRSSFPHAFSPSLVRQQKSPNPWGGGSCRSKILLRPTPLLPQKAIFSPQNPIPHHFISLHTSLKANSWPLLKLEMPIGSVFDRFLMDGGGSDRKSSGSDPLGLVSRFRFRTGDDELFSCPLSSSAVFCFKEQFLLLKITVDNNDSRRSRWCLIKWSRHQQPIATNIVGPFHGSFFRSSSDWVAEAQAFWRTSHEVLLLQVKKKLLCLRRPAYPAVTTKICQLRRPAYPAVATQVRLQRCLAYPTVISLFQTVTSGVSGQVCLCTVNSDDWSIQSEFYVSLKM